MSHTTNYKDTFITVADDCPASIGEQPPVKGDKRSVANIQFDMIWNNPYRFTSDEVIFGTYAERKDLTEGELDAARETFFAKGQPCLRASPLTKRYGWGVHHDEQGRIALYGLESEGYEKMINDKRLKVVKAMKTSR